MRKDRFESWLQNIFTTKDDEISCSECFELVSCFVELEFTGGGADEKMPQVVQHLHQCAACRAEYDTLHELRSLEESGDSPSVDDLKASLHS